MTNIDTVNALLTAINFDRFADIEALHNPDATFASFMGPILHDSVAIADWHTTFLREYADCNYTEMEYLEDGDRVGVRATIEAKGYTWRPFTQRVVESYVVEGRGIARRFLYGMLRDLELDKPTTKAMEDAAEFPGGSPAATKKAADAFVAAIECADFDHDATAALFDDKAVLIDTVYGNATGLDNIIEASRALPLPLFGTPRVTNALYGPKDALIELAIDPSRPRQAYWVRVVEGKIRVIESYWMLREIGIKHTDPERHKRQIIPPI
jgi:hypothetical protein